MKLPESSELVTKSAVCFYHVLQELKTKSTNIKFNISDYMRVIRKGIREEKVVDEKTLFRYIYEYYEMGLTGQEKMVLNLMLVFALIGLDKETQTLMKYDK